MREIHAKNVSIIDLGRQGENLATQVIYDLSDWIAEYGDGTAELIHKRVGDLQPYPVAAVRDGNTLIWTVTSTDTAVATKPPIGYGKCEMRWYVGDVLAKSKTWKTLVSQAMDTPSETAPPDHDQGGVDQVVAAGVSAKASAESAKTDADRAETAAIKQPYPDAESGTWWIWDAVSGAYVDSGFSALPDTIAGCIHAPATAEVGQTIVVKAVDENGKPTEWEAADMASGGGQWGIDMSSREPDMILEFDEAVQYIMVDSIDGNAIDAKEIAILWEHPAGVDGAAPSYFRFNNAVASVFNDTTNLLSNFNLSGSLFASSTEESTSIIRVKKITDSVYQQQYISKKQNAGSNTGLINNPYFDVYRNSLGNTSIKQLVVYQVVKIQPGTKVSIWIK